MGNNYRTSLESDLSERIQQLRRLELKYAKAEAFFEKTEQDVATIGAVLEEAVARCNCAKEGFRHIHSIVSNVQQQIGELQDELFATAEEEKEWEH